MGLNKNIKKKVLEHHYEQLFKYANDIITLHDEDLKIVEVNDRALKVFGYTKEEMVGMDVSLLFAPSMRNYIPELRKTLDEVGSIFFETIRIRKDGSEFPAEVSARIIEIEGLKYCQSIGRDITDRKLTEGKNKQLQEYIQLQIERMPIGLIVWDTEFRVESWNPAAEKIFGFKSDEVLGNQFFDNIIPRKALIHVHDIWKRLLEGDTTAHSINENITKDGKNIVCHWSNTPLKEPDGKIKSVLSMVQDITERIQAEERLKSSEERLKILFDYAPDAYYLSDYKGNFLDGNIAAEKLLGYDRNELIGKNFLKLNLLSAKQLPKAAKLLLRNSLGHATGPDEFVLNRRDGSEVIVEIITYPLKIKDKALTLGLARDITERKKTENKLLQSYEFSDTLVKTIPFGMDIVDESGTILFLNDRLKRIFGDESIGKKCWELFRDNKIQCSNCPLKDGIKIGETDKYEAKGVFGDKVFEIHHTGMYYEGRKAMLEIVIDITDRIRYEEDLLLAKEQAEEGDRLKTAFLHNISHEIRTPLNAIVGFCSLINEPGIDSSTRQSYTETIINSSDNLLSIITDIINISNIEAKIIKVTKNEVLLNSLMRSLYDHYLNLANIKNLNLVLIPGLPDEDSIILTDKTKLTQIITNLLNNALKFTQQGQIKFGYIIKEKFLEFYVSDTGLGISEKYHQKIFDRFYQLEDPETKLYEGTGLGLSICKAYIELLGGEIRLVSKLGEGSTFYFTLPFEQPRNNLNKAFSLTKEMDIIFPENKKILIAEDIDSNFQLIEYFLHGSNVTTLRASNGKEAVQKCLSDKTIDMILMDIKMPIMDGYEATKLIRESNKKIPIIAQTAYADDKLKVMGYGFSGIITKPFNRKEVLETIKEFIY